MSLLTQLLNSETQPPREPESRRLPAATVATVATQPPDTGKESQESQESQGVGAKTYARLLALTDNAALVAGLSEADLLNVADEPDDNLRLYLRMLQDSGDMDAGLVPQGWTAEACCGHCGPVWLSPGLAAGLPMRDGWRYAWGCPWCWVTGYVPRPPIESGTCRRWLPDFQNRPGGFGACQCGDFYPHERHCCGMYRPKPRWRRTAVQNGTVKPRIEHVQKDRKASGTAASDRQPRRLRADGKHLLRQVRGGR